MTIEARALHRYSRRPSGFASLVGLFVSLSFGACGTSTGGGANVGDAGSSGSDASGSGSEASAPNPDAATVADGPSAADVAAPTEGGLPTDSGVAPDTSALADTGVVTDSGNLADSAGQTDSASPMDSGHVADTGSPADTGSVADSSKVDSGSTPFPFNPSFILGADISWVSQHEAQGDTYSDGASVKPMEEIMSDNGFNYVRLRTFVQPSASGGYAQGSANQTGVPGYGTSTGGWCSTADTVAKVLRMKKCGLGVLVDFHMSDTWASIGSQIMPSSWVGLSQTVPATPVSASTHDNNIFQAAHDYVAGAMTALLAAGAKPDMVQIGNETNGGMSGINLGTAAFTALVNAGVKAVREADPSIIVWAQNGRPRPDSAGGSNFDGWVDDYLKNDTIDEDGICGSTYGTTDNGADWSTCFTYVFTTYSKPVMSCEYVNTSPDNNAGAVINALMHGFPNKWGRGSFVWEPADYPSAGPNVNGTLFSLNGKVYTTNSAMAAYPTLAKSYGLPVPASTTCGQ
jgi:arabinogalactan endo-1,4-beta-galactosidase